MRARYGPRLTAVPLSALAGVAAGGELLGGVPRWVSVAVAAFAVSTLVLRGSFHRVEHVLLVLSAVFATYVVAGFLAHPDWGAAARGLVVPSLPLLRHGLLVVVATVGTTLAPLGPRVRPVLRSRQAAPGRLAISVAVLTALSIA